MYISPCVLPTLTLIHQRIEGKEPDFENIILLKIYPLILTTSLAGREKFSINYFNVLCKRDLLTSSFKNFSTSEIRQGPQFHFFYVFHPSTCKHMQKWDKKQKLRWGWGLKSLRISWKLLRKPSEGGTASCLAAKGDTSFGFRINFLAMGVKTPFIMKLLAGPMLRVVPRVCVVLISIMPKVASSTKSPRCQGGRHRLHP